MKRTLGILVLMAVMAGGAWAMVSTAQVTCTTSATLVKPAGNGDLAWKLTNTDATAKVFLGDAAVTASTGDALPAGGSIVSTRSDALNDPLYCITASGTVVVTRTVWTP